MDELLQEMRENIQILMETAEVLENQIARLKGMDPEEANRFVKIYQRDLEQRNISVEENPSNHGEQRIQESENPPIRRKHSIKSKL